MDDIAVSVVIPMYRGEKTIRQSLESVLNQDVAPCEIIALDDGSPDECGEIVKSMIPRARDKRLSLYRHENRGLAGTLNRGIELARGKYIARQDQDDLAMAGRLAKQKAFLDKNPDIAMVGTWAQIYVDQDPSSRFHRHPTSPDALRLFLLFDNPFVHSSVMIRADVLHSIGGYSEDPERQPPEDYELWSRIARNYQVANLPEVLTVYREMPGSMSRTGENPFLRKVLRISSENIYAVIGDRYDGEDCLSLSCIYHAATGAPREIRRREAMQMLALAIERISHTLPVPSDEFHVEERRLKRHVESRFIHRRLPAPVLTLARRVRDCLFSRWWN
ncbi:MAG TPA: glycosyltransferase [Ferrovaceae bacterium]|nr:glycosyltransferase [Ferrovaceae bacterium]